MLVQVSFEFITLLVLIILSFTFVFYFSLDYFQELNKRKIFYAAQNIADDIAKEIDVAVKVGSGYSRVFYIEEKILGYIDYEIIYLPYTVKIKWDNNYIESKTLAKEIVGKVENGKNFIRNIGGQIYVN
ncbi:MAG: hypothetical protein QXD89_02210 [Candidatus Aenigmatarchaeota archaeon]